MKGNTMQAKVLSVNRRQGKAKETGKDYNFIIVGALIQTRDGMDFVEIMLDGDAVMPEPGKTYEAEIAFYPDQQRRLKHKVVALRPADGIKRAA